MGSQGRQGGSPLAVTIAVSLISGACLGAAGLASWLWKRADRRRRLQQHQALLFSSRLQDGSEASEINAGLVRGEQGSRRELQERVEALNVAINEVRRQLEDLSPRR